VCCLRSSLIFKYTVPGIAGIFSKGSIAGSIISFVVIEIVYRKGKRESKRESKRERIFKLAR